MTTAELRALAALVQRSSGIAVPESQLPSLHAALARVGPQLTAQQLLRNPDATRLERLIDEVSVKETFFLRHPEELAEADWPTHARRAAAAGRPVRVWSAGCSTGEEAYTLALLAAEALGSPAPLDVLGSDLSPSALATAERGRYGARSMRLLNPARRERWFTSGREWSVGGELRALVRFIRHNLVADPFPPLGEPPFDVVVCRNVLIYFDADTVARVIASLSQSLVPGGQLLLGTIDRLGSRTAPSPRPAVAPPAKRPRRRAARHGRPAPARPTRIETATRPAAAPVEPPPAAVAPTPAPAAPLAAADAPPRTAADDAFEAGSRALSDGDAASAVTALRRALYLDPRRAVAALQLGRAHERLGQLDAARGAYGRALRLVDETADPDARLFDRVGAADVAAACRARLQALDAEAGPSRRASLSES